MDIIVGIIMIIGAVGVFTYALDFWKTGKTDDPNTVAIILSIQSLNFLLVGIGQLAK